MNPEDKIAQQIAEFVLNHEQNINDCVADFELLADMLAVIKSSMKEETI